MFASKAYQIFKELIAVFLKFFQKIKEKGAHPNSCYKASITVIPKPDKDTTRKLQANIPDEHGCENPQQMIRRPNSAIH